MNTSDNKHSLLNNTLDSFKSLIAYDLYNCRAVFEHDGDEIVFVNNSWIGRVRIYLNGSIAYSGWDWSGMIYSTGQFLHKGKTYKIKCVVNNLITFAQVLTLSVDSQVVGTKTDEMLARLTLKEIGLMMLGGGVVGVLVVGLLKVLGV